MLKEFKEFISKGNLVELAVGRDPRPGVRRVGHVVRRRT